MAFASKLFYLAVFPGFFFILVSGTLARGLKQIIPVGGHGQESAFPASSMKTLLGLIAGETIANGGQYHALLWIGPALKLFALSWITCMVFGFMSGDLFLFFTLLLMFSSVDLFICWLSGGKRVRQQCWRTATAIIGWAVPFSLVLSAIALRTETVSIQGILSWQTAYGPLVISPEGGTIALVGAIVMVPAAFLCLASLAGLKPFGTRVFTYQPGDVASEFSGAPLAMFCASQTSALIVMPLLLIVLLFAGPASGWLEVLFWILKVAGALILMLLLDFMTTRAERLRIFYWMVGLGGTLAMTALILTWTGVGI
ncbi:MAG: NADH-quinone oxidoreductase subunit H [Actinobacteria bacterium]|nr:NADH-quinone oxidoreductase subunit H [Actinomycetota bacterium]